MPTQNRSSRFPTTQWSLIVEAGARDTPEARAALAALCETYWYPLYAFARRSGHNEDDSRDLIQGFFAQFLAGDYLRERSPAKGRFRSYLLGALKHFVANECSRSQAAKRGGKAKILPLEIDLDDGARRYSNEPATQMTPEHVFEQRWALTLLGRTLAVLQARYREAGKLALYETLEGFLPGGRFSLTYREAADRLEMPVEKVKGVIHRLRKQYREMLREEVAHTVSAPEEIDEEIRHLIEAVGGGN